MAEEDNLFSRWSRRKRAVAEENQGGSEGDPGSHPGQDEAGSQTRDLVSQEVEPDTEEEEAALLERLGLPVPETLKEGDDFSVFMAKGVPQFLRKRALRILWKSNPVLANLDGLNDYDEDFNSPELTQKVLATGYQVGKGFARRVVEAIEGEDEPEPEEDLSPDDAEPVDNQIAENNSSTLEEDGPAPIQPEPEDHSAPRPRRMRFET